MAKVKLSLDKIKEQFVIVLDTTGDLVYQIDDEDVFWIHKKGGLARGSRFACISEKSFFDTEYAASKGIDYLRTCHFSTASLVIIKVKLLEQLFKKSYEWLLSDIESHNDSVDFNEEFEEARKEEYEKEEIELHHKLRVGKFDDVESKGDGIYVVTININE